MLLSLKSQLPSYLFRSFIITTTVIKTVVRKCKETHMRIILCHSIPPPYYMLQGCQNNIYSPTVCLTKIRRATAERWRQRKFLWRIWLSWQLCFFYCFYFSFIIEIVLMLSLVLIQDQCGAMSRPAVRNGDKWKPYRIWSGKENNNYSCSLLTIWWT
jgi:hypothetical protein